MRLTHRQIIGLPVETSSGTKLGSVQSLVIDADRQTVVQYVVKPMLLPRFLASTLLIAPEQVVALTNVKMVVVDSAVPAAAAAVSPS